MKRDLSAWLAWQEQAHPKAWDLGLARIGAVWKRLGAPRLAQKILTVAGTNGKGSCVRWAEAIALAQGLRVGSFSSPHLLDYRERIRFQAKWVHESALVAAFERIDAARGDVSLTYFEWSALAAFDLMAREALDVAVLEVGLGGRLDACNLIDADSAIITRIGLDHQDWLGDNIEAIAREKAGILRAGQALYLSDKHAPQALLEAAEALQISVQRCGRDFDILLKQEGFILKTASQDYDLPLPQSLTGAHQLGQFAAVALALSAWFGVDERAWRQALHTAHNPGRLSLKNIAQQAYLFDVAHNEDSAEVLAAELQRLSAFYPKIAVVCGMLRDKDQVAILKRFQALSHLSWHLAALNAHPRGSDEALLSQSVAQAGLKQYLIHANVTQALQAASADLIVVMGSFITVAEALTFLEHSLS